THVELRDDSRRLDLHPSLFPQATVLPRKDELAEREIADLGSFDVVPRHLLQHLVAEECHLAADVRQSAMRGGELELAVHHPDDAKNPDVDPVLEVLLTEVFGDDSVVGDGPNAIVFALA